VLKTLTVVAPVYNEDEAVGAFYRSVTDVFDSISDRYRATVLFVVDRSEDDTLATLRAIAKADSRVQVLALSARFGHQMSLLAGIDHAYSDAVITMDADLEHPPELIPELIASGVLDCVLKTDLQQLVNAVQNLLPQLQARPMSTL